MLSKDAWLRDWSSRLLLVAALAAAMYSPGCRRWERQVYNPAPTPLFMEEGLRQLTGGNPSPPAAMKAGKAAEGIVGMLDSTHGDVATASHTAETAAKSDAPQLPPPTQPPATQPPGPPPQPATPEPALIVPAMNPNATNPNATNPNAIDPGGANPNAINPYEMLPGTPGEPYGVSLAQAIDEALMSSVEVRAGLENVVQAQADVTTAGLLPNPQIMILASLEPYPGHHFSPTRQGGPPQYDVWQTWPIDWFLFQKRKAAIEAAARQVDLTAAEFADFARQRVALTVATFFGILEAKALLQVARENAANLERVVNLTQIRFKNEAAARIDVERAQISLSTARRDIRLAEATLTAAKSQLRALMGRQGLDPTFDVAGVLSTTAATAPPPLDAALSVAEQWRPDMMAAWRRIELAQAQVILEDKKRLPTVAVQSGWTLQDQKTSIGYPSAQSWNAGFTFPLPVNDRNQGNRWKARSALAQAQIALEARRIQVRNEVEQSIAAYDAAYKIVTSDAPQQLEAARSVRNRVEEAYREGGRSLFELLSAEQTYRDTYRLQINAEVGYWRAIHQLNAMVGQQIVP